MVQISLLSFFTHSVFLISPGMETGDGGRVEAKRLLEIAEKLLDARDLVGSKRFAERSLESDPLLDGVDQILAIVDVLLASQRQVSNQPDWYAILHLPRPSSSSSDAAAGDVSLDIKRSYRRLALLLRSDRNKLPYADYAFRFVIDAFAILSNPQKKSLYDAQLPSNNPAASRSFWTSCHACYHVFEYDRAYIDRTLLCRICMRPFHASEMAVPPPIVAGIDMYYCAWGFFPLGFTGSGFPNSDAVKVSEVGVGWKPFYPVRPRWGNQTGEHQDMPLNAVPINVAAANANAAAAASIKRSFPTRIRKVVAKKRVRNFARKNALFGETDSEPKGLEARGVGGSVADAPEQEGISSFDIDLDATEEVLGNLHDLPFM